MTKSKLFTMVLDEVLHREIRNAAFREETSMAMIVRRAVRATLNGDGK